MPLAKLTKVNTLTEAEADEIYLRLDTTNDPLTNDLVVQGDVDLRYLQFDTDQNDPDDNPGLMFWDKDAVRNTLIYWTISADIDIEVGRDVTPFCVNKSGSTIAKGKVVYVDGGANKKPTIALAKADAASTARSLGITLESIGNNNSGMVAHIGSARNMDTSAWVEDDLLWLSPTVAGDMTNVAPVSPNYRRLVGTVTRSNATGGSIYLCNCLDLSYATFGNLFAYDGFQAGSDTQYLNVTNAGVMTLEGVDARFQAFGDDWVFRYTGTNKAGVTKDTFGFWFNATGAMYEFLQNAGTPIFSFRADNGNTTIGSIGTGTLACGNTTITGLSTLGDGGTTNYAEVDANGRLRLYGAGVFEAFGDDYVFRYSGLNKVGVPKNQYGFWFDATSAVAYQFLTAGGAVLTSIGANTGDISTIGHVNINNNKSYYAGSGNAWGTTHNGTNTLTDIVTGEWQIGDGTGTNYTAFENNNGFMEANGTAVAWKDINVGAATLSGPPGLQPGIVNYVDEVGADTGIATYGLSVGEGFSGQFELQHDYEEGTDITFHVHWQGITAPTGTDNVQFELTYTVGKANETLDAATTITTETGIDVQYDFKISSFTAITGTNFAIGDQFVFTLERIAASANEYGGEALTATVGIHYKVNTLGSRNITSK